MYFIDSFWMVGIQYCHCSSEPAYVPGALRNEPGCHFCITVSSRASSSVHFGVPVLQSVWPNTSRFSSSIWPTFWSRFIFFKVASTFFSISGSRGMAGRASSIPAPVSIEANIIVLISFM